MSQRNQAGQREADAAAPPPPPWLFPVAGGRSVRRAPPRRAVPAGVGTDVRGWPAARRETVLTALMSAARNAIVVDIDMEAGTALVHQLAGAPERDPHPALPG